MLRYFAGARISGEQSTLSPMALCVQNAVTAIQGILWNEWIVLKIFPQDAVSVVFQVLGGFPEVGLLIQSSMRLRNYLT
jgi:hypothetical protein